MELAIYNLLTLQSDKSYIDIAFIHFPFHVSVKRPNLASNKIIKQSCTSAPYDHIEEELSRKSCRVSHLPLSPGTLNNSDVIPFPDNSKPLIRL